MIIIYFLLLFLILIRLLRFLAVVQQKEYRLDRLATYFNSESGKRDLIKIWPAPKDLTRTGLKRPVRTMRVLVIGGATLLVIFLLYLIIFFLADTDLVKLTFWSLVLVFLPLLVMLVMLPTSIVAMIMTWIELQQASQKLSIQMP
jgi:hypothetical protein